MSTLNYSNALCLGIYNARSLQQQSPCRHLANFRHNIMIPGQPVFDLTPYNFVLIQEAANTNVTVFGLTLAAVDAFVSTITLEH